jgi:uncharacterized membrane protein YhaH (DUF805 family)
MDDIQKAVKTCFSKYADFSGRAARPEFWYFALFQFVVLVVVGIVSQTLQGLVSLALLLPALAVGARRLHDIGKSAWFLLVGLIPFIGWLVMIYWFVQPSVATNEYGTSATVIADTPPMAPGEQ